MKYNENYITLYNITNICSGPPAKDMPKNGHDATHLPNLHIFVLLLAMIQMGSWFMKKKWGYPPHSDLVGGFTHLEKI